MKSQGLLLFAIMANFVEGGKQQVEFPVKVIEPDLEAISLYYERNPKNNDYKAYVHWPDSNTFYICKHWEYLHIDGTFTENKSLKRSVSYYGLYYLNGQFYGREEGKSDSLTPISSNQKLDYKAPPGRTIKKPYVEIRYSSLEELSAKIKVFYKRDEQHYDKVLHQHPAIFLVTYPDHYFVEYRMWGRKKDSIQAEGELRALLMKKSGSELKLSDSVITFRPVFDQRNEILIIPKTEDIESQPFDDVFGVRMNSVAFLAEVAGSEVTLYNEHDLHLGFINLDVRTFLHDLQEKLKIVEPRLNYPGVFFSEAKVPQSLKFQLHGYVLIKKINIRNGSINEECPFIIEKANSMPFFEIKNRNIRTICANHDTAWPNEND